jgi:NADPH-dependent 2,4-dienoyl-CoA reductase/sulfur reductase-like enzyme
LLGKRPHASLLVLNEAYFRDHGVQVLLGTRALAVEPQKRRVCTDSAGDFTYRKLLIATGGCPRRLEVPGADLSGIFYLRTLAEAEALQWAMAKAKRAAVVGSIFIAMELSASFAEQGIKTTLIAREDRLYSKLDSPEISAFFADYYRARGVEIVFRETVKIFQGNGRVERLMTSSGRDLALDLVAAGYPSAATPGSLPAARRGDHGPARAAAHRPDQAQPPLPPNHGRGTPALHQADRA